MPLYNPPATGVGVGTFPATKIIKLSNSVGSYPNADYVADGTNDNADVQAAIDALAGTAFGRGMILISEGTLFNAAAWQLRTGISIFGMGIGATEIRSVGTDGGSYPSMIRLADTSVHVTTVARMFLNGNFTSGGNVGGLWYDNEGGTFTALIDTNPDPFHSACDLLIKGTGTSAANRDGIRSRNAADTNTGNARECKFDRIYIQQPGRDGIYWDAPDTTFTDVTCRDGRRYGIHGAGGNNRFASCKSYFNDDAGFFIPSARQQFVGCQAQDNGGHGYDISASNTILSGCQADSNGRLFATTTRASGFRFGASRAVAIGCHSFDRGQTPGSPQRNGYDFVSGSDTVCIGSADANSVAPYTGNLAGQQIVVITSPQGDIFRQNIGRPFLAAINSAPVDADIGNSQVSLWANETNDRLELRWRDSTGALFTRVIAT